MHNSKYQPPQYASAAPIQEADIDTSRLTPVPPEVGDRLKHWSTIELAELHLHTPGQPLGKPGLE